MQTANIRTQWEGAAPGWARWEATVAAWMEPATEAMLAMAGVDTGARMLDLASGAGSQTVQAARRVGAPGHVVASDIADTRLHHVRENARAAGFTNVTTLAGAAEDLDVAAESFDVVICRLGLMLFAAPAQALAAVRHALHPGGKVAVVVLTTPAANPCMAQPMPMLLCHAGKTSPAPGQPGIFALGAPGVLERWLGDSGFVGVEQRTVALPLRMPSAAQARRTRLEPIGEPVFDDSRVGYRCSRSAKEALRQVWRDIDAGAEWIVDADLQDDCGTLDHEQLMTLVAERVADGRVLMRSERMLTAGDMQHGRLCHTPQGTPQGGVGALRSAQR